MAKPNKTVARFRRNHPNFAAEAAARERLSAPSPAKDIMDAVSRGEMTPDEGAQKMRELMEREG